MFIHSRFPWDMDASLRWHDELVWFSALPS